jgi:hypothetical protein
MYRLISKDVPTLNLYIIISIFFAVKMKKKFEEDAAALEQSAEIPAAQSCPVSSSLFTGARYRPNQSPVGLPIPSTDSHEETLMKTEPFEEKFKKAEPIEGTHKRANELPYVTQQISQVRMFMLRAMDIILQLWVQWY